MQSLASSPHLTQSLDSTQHIVSLNPTQHDSRQNIRPDQLWMNPTPMSISELLLF